MRRVRWILLAAALLASVSGCNSRKGMPLATSAYRGVEQGSLLAWGWGGAPGFQDENPHEVVVLFNMEPGDRNHRLMTCNPRASECKGVNDFADTGLEPQTEDEIVFGRFDTGVEKEDHLFLVVADRGAKLITSDVITATVKSRPTTYSSGELHFDRGTQQLAWPRLPDNDLFVLTLSDDAAELPLTAITTRRKSWIYPELQGIVQYFHDPAQVRDLRPGGRYVAVLYSVNKQGWATLVTNAVVKP